MQQVAKSTTIVTKIKNLAIGGILMVLALPLVILMPIFPGLRRQFQAVLQFRSSDVDIKVLLEMLHAVSIDPSPDAVNPLLNAHCDRLNEALGQQLYRWSHSTLTQVSASDAPGIAATIVNFSNRVRTFGGGDRAANLEIARLGYESVLTFYNPSDFPQEWAMVQYNLGHAYCDRERGNPEDNLEMAISAFENALQIFTPEDYPQEYALSQRHLMETHQKKLCLNAVDRLEELISNP